MRVVWGQIVCGWLLSQSILSPCGNRGLFSIPCSSVQWHFQDPGLRTLTGLFPVLTISISNTLYTALCREWKKKTNPYLSLLNIAVGGGELSSRFQWRSRRCGWCNRLRKWKRGKWRMRKKKYVHRQGCGVIFFPIQSEFVGMGCFLGAKARTLCV